MDGDIELKIGTLDPKLPDPAQWDPIYDGMVDQTAGDIILKKPASEFIDGDAGSVITDELEERGYFEIFDEKAEERIQRNQRGGNGKYILLIIDENIHSNADAQIRCIKEAAVQFGPRGSFSFETEIGDWEIGDTVRLIVIRLKIDVTWPVQHIDIDTGETPSKYSITCSPRTPISADDLTVEAFNQLARKGLRLIGVGPYPVAA